MVYMIGSDLESEDGLASRDLKEMQAALRGDTTLLLMAGGRVIRTLRNDELDIHEVHILTMGKGDDNEQGSED